MNQHIPINYMTGDATRPAGVGPAIIAHICNDVGGWGAGFVMALSKRWKEPEAQYRLWFKGKIADAQPFSLGEVMLVEVGTGVHVANMIAQHGIRWQGNEPPIRYEALDQALGRLADAAHRIGASVHMPRIGCGLAGGTWERVEPLIQSRLSDRGIAVVVYDFAES